MTNTSANLGIPDWERRHRLARALEWAGLTPAEMAEYIGRTDRTVRHYLAGTVEAPIAVLRVWALRCGVPYEWLLTGELRANGPEPGQTSWMSWYLHRPSVEGAA